MSVHSGMGSVDIVKVEDLVMEWSAQKNLMKQRVEVAAFHVGEQSGSTYVGQIKFVQLKEGEFIDPTLKMSLSEAKSLANALADAGVFPDHPDPSKKDDGELAALKAHLEDMRQVAFSFLQLKE